MANHFYAGGAGLRLTAKKPPQPARGSRRKKTVRYSMLRICMHLTGIAPVKSADSYQSSIESAKLLPETHQKSEALMSFSGRLLSFSCQLSPFSSVKPLASARNSVSLYNKYVLFYFNLHFTTRSRPGKSLIISAGVYFPESLSIFRRSSP